ncbi:MULTISPECIES: GNAT family N-acetyltransferase [unclassified Pseudomonas]|jgi:GNAT superfamily N-acetyltransferase|uniref:GNAT family N-acetyltransferase n=1 Tax=unclassified Pseudomonas TaxID=196821 RepID=UPI002A36B686|nr:MULTISPECIES: GNAT family N-acetyltransferase [unclassified Pseudomonas]MDX9670876.1 GNAT family N-acetyltransferase [Pseudomonas sp. P8_250]WPN35132.1 GNAT family N-acetyltransferase [Pseudomonas sp. P8_139]WPN43068.1 GNAT family N-acetyltransferase [Pseudomonas sp. P8_229]
MKNNLTVRNLLPDEVESVRQFLGQHGWGHRTGSSDHFAQLIENSQRTAVALSDEQIIGFARGITDGLSNGYLSMVVVDDQHRRAGVGRALVEHVMGDNSDITWVLRAGREGAEAFFASLGFETSVIAMERPRLK